LIAHEGPVPVLTLIETGSTNAEVRSRAEAGETGPLWITALRQTAGRGRRGRVWEDKGGNLATTLLMTTALPPAQAAQVSFVAALAVADLVDRYLAEPITRLKWPNDALVQGRKVSGILVESGARPDGQLWLAVGIGINLQTPPQNPERPAAAVGDFLGATVPSQAQAMEGLSQTFDHWLKTWQQGGFEPIAKAWTARAYGLGLACTARLGHETVEGVAEGLDSDGALRLRLADGSIRCISAGDVFFGDA